MQIKNKIPNGFIAVVVVLLLLQFACSKKEAFNINNSTVQQPAKLQSSSTPVNNTTSNNVKKPSALSQSLFMSEPYKVDKIEDHKDLKVAVLRIPVTKKNNNGTVQNQASFPSTTKLQGGLNLKNSNLAKDSNSQKPLYNQTDKIKSMNAEYIADMTQYQDSVVSSSLSNVHISMLNILTSTTKPSVVYVFYNDIQNKLSEVPVNKQLKLTAYVNLIRKYIYTQNKKNIFVQEVQYKDLPFDEVLIVVKPISQEVFDNLPAEVNMFNAPKVNGDEWFATVNRLEKEKNIKLQNLYKSNS